MVSRELGNSKGGPLRGRRIVVTRDRDQAAEFVTLLERAGAEVLTLPLIQISDPQSWSEADDALDHLASFDFVVFTSGNAVRKWIDRAATRGLPPVQNGQRVCAVGEATARSLKERGIRVDATPKKFNAQALVEMLGSNLHGRRVLLPRGDLARPELPQGLRARGAEVREVVVYRTLPASTGSEEWIRRIEHDQIDVITFASPSAVQQFVAWLGAAQIGALRGHFRAASIGPTTSASLREHGFDVAIEAHPSTLEGLTAAITAYLQKF